MLCLSSKKSAVGHLSQSVAHSQDRPQRIWICIPLTGIERIQAHGLEALPLLERRAGPLPDATHLALATQAVTMCRDGSRMPVLEPDVSPVQVDEEVTLLFIDRLSRASYWWRFLDAIIAEVTEWWTS